MTYAAFLRAINVGKHNRIRMADLRALVEELGYGDVRTYLQTGNMVLDAGRQKPATVAARLEEALTASGLKNVDVMVRTRAELEELVRAQPFAGYDAETHYRFVLFTKTPVEPPTAPLELKGVTFCPRPGSPARRLCEGLEAGERQRRGRVALEGAGHRALVERRRGLHARLCVAA